jgi:quercetin dioxygenase-like cupin family protein
VREAPPDSLAGKLAREGLTVSEWSNGPTETYAGHRHAYDKVLVPRAGSITFHLTELGRDVELRTGERLELPAETLHGATVGSRGVICLQAHLPAGSVGHARAHLTDDW